MPLLRLAYSTQFLIALIAVFVLWSQVGGQSHLELMPWYLKLGLGAGAAFATVKATAAAVAQKDRPWSGPTLKWVGIVLALLVGCGMASYYYHLYGETDESDEGGSQTSSLLRTPLPGNRLFAVAARPNREENVPFIASDAFRIAVVCTGFRTIPAGPGQNR
jgi:hypothetical protein